MRTLNELNSQLAAERSKHDRLGERTHNARLALESAEKELESLLRATTDEQISAALEEKSSPVPDSRKLSAARSKVAAAESTLTAQRTAMEMQAAVVEGIEAEIAARRHEAFAAELAPARRKAMDLMSKFCAAACELEGISRKHGVTGYALASSLLPIDPADPITGSTERCGRIALINGALSLNYHLACFGRAV